MRTEFTRILKSKLRFLAISTRERLKLTQKEMGALLQMSESSYSDIETGRTMCSALTTVLLLTLQDDPEEILHDIKDEFSKWYEDEMRTA